MDDRSTASPAACSVIGLMSSDDLFGDHEISSVVIEALQLASIQHPGRPLDTLVVLRALIRSDYSGDWSYILLQTGDPEGFHGEDATTGQVTVWRGLPINHAVARAMRRAAELCERGELVTISAGLLALGLADRPSNAATQALLDGSRLEHDALLELLQESLLGFSGSEWTTDEPAVSLLDRARQTNSQPRDDKNFKTTSLIEGTTFEFTRAAEAIARKGAAARDVTGAPDVVALLLACTEHPSTANYEDLFERMSLSYAEVAELADPLATLPTESAANALARLELLFPGEAPDAATCLAAACLGASNRLHQLLHLMGLDPPEVAAQLIDARMRRTDRSITSDSAFNWSIVNLAGRMLLVALLISSVARTGEWWKLLLLQLVFIGYPASGPLVQVALSLPTFLLLPPWVGIAQLAVIPLDWANQAAERRAYWSATGARLTLRQLRRVLWRRLNPHSRLAMVYRQLILSNWRQRRAA